MRLNNKNLPTKKILGSDGFAAEFYLMVKELKVKSFKTFHKIQRERTILNSFYEASITLIPKVNKDTTTNL